MLIRSASMLLLAMVWLAAPVGVEQVSASPPVAAAVVGTPADGSSYQLQMNSVRAVGCFGNDDDMIDCMCPIQAQPIIGSFALELISQEDGVTEYAVVDIDWDLSAFVEDGDPLPLPDSEITGSGTYLVIGAQHQMILDLDVVGQPATYDSGLVDGADLPAIDITVSLNHFQSCFDEAFSIMAEPSAQPDDVSQTIRDSAEPGWSRE